MSVCEKHGCHQEDWWECPGCVREERDRLQHELTDEKANSESWRQQHENRVGDVLRISKELEVMREERDMLLAKLDEAVKLLKRRMHCDICECPGCLEVRKVIEG